MWYACSIFLMIPFDDDDDDATRSFHIKWFDQKDEEVQACCLPQNTKHCLDDRNREKKNRIEKNINNAQTIGNTAPQRNAAK